MYGKTQTSGLAEFIPFIGTSAIWGQPCPLVHLASCIPPAPQQSLWGMVASAGSVFLETSFTFGGQKSLMVVTFLVDQYGRRYFHFTRPQFSSVAQPRAALYDSTNSSTPGFPVHHQLPESAQIHVHRVGNGIQPSHPLSPTSSPTFNLSQHQGLFK